MTVDSGVKSISAQNTFTNSVQAQGDKLGVYFATFAGGTLGQVQASLDNATWIIVKVPESLGGDADTGKVAADTGLMMIDAIPGLYYRAGVATGDYGSGTTTARIFG